MTTDQKEKYTGKVLRMAYGGEGILSVDGLICFTPFTIEGEEVEVEVYQRKKNHSFAQILDIIKPSDSRVDPKCKHFGSCGGCQWQHIDYLLQLEFKGKFIRDHLIRIGKFTEDQLPDIEVFPSQNIYNHRRVIRPEIKFDHQLKRFQVGLYSVGNEFFPIEECKIFDDTSSIIQNINKDQLDTLKLLPKEKAHLTLLKNDLNNNIILMLEIKSFRTAKKFLHWAQSIYNDQPFPIQGVLVRTKSDEVVLGQIVGQMRFDSFTFNYSPKVFLQNNPSSAQEIIKDVINIVNQNGPQKILDLYCGLGVYSLLLASKGHEIIGVELNQDAIDMAYINLENNFKKLHMNGKVNFICGDVAKVWPLIYNESNRIAIVNPPRKGLDEKVIDLLLNSELTQIIYVSCMPSTLARDLKILREQGTFRINQIKGYDHFPQTSHVETLVHLIRD